MQMCSRYSVEIYAIPRMLGRKALPGLKVLRMRWSWYHCLRMTLFTVSGEGAISDESERWMETGSAMVAYWLEACNPGATSPSSCPCTPLRTLPALLTPRGFLGVGMALFCVDLPSRLRVSAVQPNPLPSPTPSSGCLGFCLHPRF